MGMQILTEILCDGCQSERLIVGVSNKPKRLVARAQAAAAGWKFQGREWLCPACWQGLERPSADRLTILLRRDPKIDHYSWAFSGWAKEIESLNLEETGGFAFAGERWLPESKDYKSGSKAYTGNYPDLTHIAVGFASSLQRNQKLCAIVERLSGAKDVLSVPFGRGENSYRAEMLITGGRIIFSATSKKSKVMMERVAGWRVTNEQLKKAANPNYLAALYLHSHKDEWKFRGDPFAIEIEEVKHHAM